MPGPLALLQEMLAIMKSIYDMMGRHTYPILREDAPLEHVERFFQVSAPALGLEGQGSQGREGAPPLRTTLSKPLPSLRPTPPTRRLNLHPPPGWLSGSPTP